MRFTTVSGSVYEVNTDSKQIRRLNGVKDPSPRLGADGQWRGYSEITPIKVGSSVAIVWSGETALMAETEQALKKMPGAIGIPATTTSMVVSVEP